MSEAPKPVKIRVLIADDDNLLARRLGDYLNNHGFEARVVNSGGEARSQILEWRPRFVLADLMLPDGNALTLIDFIRNQAILRPSQISVLVTSGHNMSDNVHKSIAHGAKDYVVKPFRHEDLLKRLVFHSRQYRQLTEIAMKDYSRVDDASLLLHQTNLVLRQALGGRKLDDVLYNLTRMVSIKVDGVRGSIVNCLDQHRGIVVMSNDNRAATGIQLDLYKYPEVLHVMNNGSLLAIENLDNSVELKFVRETVNDISFNSIIVCPVKRKGEPFGVLSVRMPPEKLTITDNEVRFVEIVSHVISLVLSDELHKDIGDFWIKEPVRAPIIFPLRRPKNS